MTTFELQQSQDIVGAPEYDPVSNYALGDQTTLPNLKNVLPYNPTPKSKLTYDPENNFLINRQSYSSKSKYSNSALKSNASISKSCNSSHISSKVFPSESNSSKSSSKSIVSISKSSTSEESLEAIPLKSSSSNSSSKSIVSISKSSTSHASFEALPIESNSSKSSSKSTALISKSSTLSHESSEKLPAKSNSLNSSSKSIVSISKSSTSEESLEAIPLKSSSSNSTSKLNATISKSSTHSQISSKVLLSESNSSKSSSKSTALISKSSTFSHESSEKLPAKSNSLNSSSKSIVSISKSSTSEESLEAIPLKSSSSNSTSKLNATISKSSTPSRKSSEAIPLKSSSSSSSSKSIVSISKSSTSEESLEALTIESNSSNSTSKLNATISKSSTHSQKSSKVLLSESDSSKSSSKSNALISKSSTPSRKSSEAIPLKSSSSNSSSKSIVSISKSSTSHASFEALPIESNSSNSTSKLNATISKSSTHSQKSSKVLLSESNSLNSSSKSIVSISKSSTSEESLEAIPLKSSSSNSTSKLNATISKSSTSSQKSSKVLLSESNSSKSSSKSNALISKSSTTSRKSSEAIPLKSSSSNSSSKSIVSISKSSTSHASFEALPIESNSSKSSSKSTALISKSSTFSHESSEKLPAKSNSLNSSSKSIVSISKSSTSEESLEAIPLKSSSSSSTSKLNATISKSSTSSQKSSKVLLSESNSSKSSSKSTALISKSSTSSDKSSEALPAKSNSLNSSSKSIDLISKTSILHDSSKVLPSKSNSSNSASKSNESISKSSTSQTFSESLPLKGDSSNSSLKSNVPTLSSNSSSFSSTTCCLESKRSHYPTPVSKSTSPSISASSNENGRSLLKVHSIHKLSDNETRESNIFNQQGIKINIEQKKKFADENKKFNISSTNSINDLTRNQDGKNIFHNVNNTESKSLKRCRSNSGPSKHAKKRKKIELSSLSFQQGSEGSDSDVENKDNSPKPHYQAVKMTSLTLAKEMLNYTAHCTPLKQVDLETNVCKLTYSDKRDDPDAEGCEAEAHKRRQAASIARKRLFKDEDINKNIAKPKRHKLMNAIEKSTSSNAVPNTQLHGSKASTCTSYELSAESFVANLKKRTAHELSLKIQPQKKFQSEETNESEISTSKNVCSSSKTQNLCLQKQTVKMCTNNISSNKVVCFPANLQLDDNELSLLRKGLSFAPSKPNCDKFDLMYAVHKYFCSIKSSAHFHYSSQQEKNDDMFSKFKSQRARVLPHPLAKIINQYIQCCIGELKKLNLQPVNESNLTSGEKQALNQLRRRKDIVIMPAETGEVVCVWSRQLYVETCQRHLTNPTIYSLKKTDCTFTSNSKINKSLKQYIKLNLLPESARNLHLFDSDLGESFFYLLADNPESPGIPFVSSNSCPTEHIALLLDDIFKPVVASLPSFIKDTDPTKLRLLFRLDKTSLYTSIPHKDGLEAVKRYFTKTPHHKISTDTIVRLTELVLTCNSLEFDGNFYEQIKGVPLGSKMSDSYVSLFMGYVDENIKEEYDGYFSELYYRCNDDGIGFTYMEKNDLDNYIKFCMRLYPDIKLKSGISNSCVNVLDLRFRVNNDSPVIRTEINSLDYLLSSPSHQKFTLQKPLKHNNLNRPILILPDHTHGKLVEDILISNFHVFSSNPIFGDHLKNPPEVIYKPNPNLQDILVHKRLPSLSPPGTSPCKMKNCKLCQYTFETNSIQFPGGVMEVSENFTCRSRSVIYVIKCKRCHKCYIGQTGLKLSQRAGQHITTIKKKHKSSVAKHFNAPDHEGLKDFSISAVRSCVNTEERKKLETRLILIYMPLGHKGMNKIFSLV